MTAVTWLEGPQVCGTCGKTVNLYSQTYSSALKKVTAITCEPCAKSERFADYAKTKQITTKLMMDATLIAHDVWNALYVGKVDWQLRARRESRERLAEKHEHDVIIAALNVDRAVQRLHEVVKTFEREVWYAGVQKIVQDAKTHGMSAKETLEVDGEKVKFLVFASAGRCMITLDTPTRDVTVITAEDEAPNSDHRGPKPLGEGPMGLQGIHATEAQAVALLEAAIAAWKRGEIKLVQDTKVGFG